MAKLRITKKKPNSVGDGYVTFSIRIKEETADKLEELSIETNRSRNELINLILEFGLDNCETK